jgi:hypothetical protein
MGRVVAVAAGLAPLLQTLVVLTGAPVGQGLRGSSLEVVYFLLAEEEGGTTPRPVMLAEVGLAEVGRQRRGCLELPILALVGELVGREMRQVRAVPVFVLLLFLFTDLLHNFVIF